MATNLTDQVREIASVTKAVANGDLTKTVDIGASGEIRELKTTVNNMVRQFLARGLARRAELEWNADLACFSSLISHSLIFLHLHSISIPFPLAIDHEQVAQLRRFAAEVTRVALEVGTEGQLGGTANIDGVQGVWKTLTDNVNTMAMNLTQQVRSIADVTRAVAEGDLSRKVIVEVKGEMLDLKVRGLWACVACWARLGRRGADPFAPFADSLISARHTSSFHFDQPPTAYRQQHGGLAAPFRGRSHACREGGRHRRSTRRAGLRVSRRDA